jgi:surface polysaccharide O-acyltransferase-like enzyme
MFLKLILSILIFGIPICFIEIFYDSKFSFNVSQIWIALFNAIQGKSWTHMWYLYMIAGLYLCIPFIKVFVINAPKSVIQYTLFLLFFFTSLIPTLESIIPYKLGIFIPIISVYIFYLILGYYIHYHSIKLNSSVLWLLIASYVLFVFLMLLNDGFVNLENDGHLILTDYNSPLVIILTFAIFCLMFQKNKQNSVMNKIAPTGFGIFHYL